MSNEKLKCITRNMSNNSNKYACFFCYYVREVENFQREAVDLPNSLTFLHAHKTTFLSISSPRTSVYESRRTGIQEWYQAVEIRDIGRT